MGSKNKWWGEGGVPNNLSGKNYDKSGAHIPCAHFPLLDFYILYFYGRNPLSTREGVLMPVGGAGGGSGGGCRGVCKGLNLSGPWLHLRGF
jgi:hypothetical protein